MSSFNKSMFESIKEELNKSKAKTGLRDILRTPPGHTYTVRLIPNIQDPKKTFFHYYNFGWESYATGEYVQFISPSTWNERDPIAEGRLKCLKHGSAEDKAKAEKLLRRENWLVNVYVINDTNEPENNGKVKMLRYGRQIQKIIDEAMNGEDADQFGSRIFDLSGAGCSFKIKAEKQGDFPTFVSSRFSSPGEVPALGSDNKKIEAVYNSVHALDTVFRVQSYDDLKAAFEKHFLCETPAQVSVAAKGEAAADDSPFVESKKSAVRTLPKPVEAEVADEDSDDLDDAKVAELLKGLS